MDTVVWIVIAAAVVAVLVIVVLAVLLSRRRRERRHAEAEHLRQQAAGHQPGLTQAELEARRTEAEADARRAEAERAAAEAEEARRGADQARARQEDLVREADRLDPAVNHRADDYRPAAPEGQRRATGADPETSQQPATGTPGTGTGTGTDTGPGSPGRHRDEGDAVR